MAYPMAEVVLDLRDVFSVFLVYSNNVGICHYYREVVTATSLTILAPRTSLAMVFFASLTLVSGRLLVLPTKYVNERSVSRLGLFEVLFLFFCRLVPLEVLKVNLPGF